MPDRNRVRFESNERVDKPDFEALQLGAHLALRYFARGLLFGSDATDQTVVTSAWTLSGAGSELTVTPGRAIAGETMSDGTIEQGHIIGEDGDTSQTIDFVGQPADTYFVYARPDFSPGVSGSRLFYNAATDGEDAAAIDTREVSGWKLTAATSSPGTGYTQVGAVTWDGAAFTFVGATGLHFWEGMLGSSGAESSNQWGDGVNDRNANRATYGVQSLFKAAALVRRQLKDIIGAASGHWGSAVPVSLTATKTHIDTTTDPHGSAPTWTGKPTFSGGLNADGEIDATGAGYVKVDAKTDLRFGSAQEGHWNIQGWGCHAFITNGVAFAHLGGTDGGNARMNNDSSTTMNIVIPFHIPHGATLTRVYAVGFWENQTGSAATLSIDVYRNTFAIVAYVNDKLGNDSLDDSGVSGSGAAYGIASVDSLSVDVVETDTFWAYIQLANNGEASKLSLVGLYADYTFDNVVG